MADDFYTHMKKEQEMLKMSMNESIRQKKERMPCKCGRSPTGKCIGWHKLTEEEYKKKKEEK